MDTFGESLVTGNRSIFQPSQSHSDNSSPSPDSARRVPGGDVPYFGSPSPGGDHLQHLQQGGPPRQRSTSLPPLPESASSGGMAAFAGYPSLLESVGASMAPTTSSVPSPTVSHPVTGPIYICAVSFASLWAWSAHSAVDGRLLLLVQSD